MNNDEHHPQTPHKQKQKEFRSQGKDEMNLAEFPIARLGRKDSREAIEYVGWTVDKKGQRHQQTWVVRSAAGLGLPTEFAERVLVALMALTAQEYFASRKVPFTVYRILKMVGLTHNKRNYKTVEKALKQLVGITIYSEGAFWDKEKNKRVTTLKGFHLIDDIWLKYLEDDEEIIEEEGVNGYIVWGDRIWNSFKSGYIKNLDIAYYYSLDNAVARRLYRFLDKRMHYQNEYQIDIFDLAARLGMTRYQYPSEVKKKMKPAFDELLSSGFLIGVEVFKKGKYTRVLFTKSNAQGWDGSSDPFPFEAADEQGDGDTSDSEAQEDAVTGEKVSEGIRLQNDSWSAFYEVYGTSEEHQNLWSQVLKTLSMSMPTPTFQQYIEHTKLLGFESNEAVVGVLHAQSKDWLENRMGNKILKALNDQLEEKIKSLQFVGLHDLDRVSDD